MAGDALAQVRAFLAEQHILSLASIGPDGSPQAANLYYAQAGDWALYFVSVPGSRHAANLARDPRVAVTIHADSQGWRDIRGLQLEGTCSRVSGARRAEAWACYIARFPFVLTDAALAGDLQKVDLYCITPRWLRWIDNTAGLGHNREWVRIDGEWQVLAAPEQ